MPSIIGNLKIWDINNRDILPPSTIYNLVIGTNTNPTGFKFLCIGDSKFEGVLNSDNINLASNGNYKINDVIIPQSILDNSGLQLDNGVLSFNFSDAVSLATLQSTDVFIFQRSNVSKRITRDELKADLDTTYTEGDNIEINSNNVITTESDLTKINSITSEINQNLIFDTDSEIQFKTNNTERLSLDSTKLDSSVNINIPSDKHYQINGIDVLHNTGTNNFILNAKFIGNSVSPYEGLFVNYLPGTTTTSHCRLYAGTTTPRLMIKADTGKIGIGTESPSEFLDVVGNIKCSGVYKGDGSLLENLPINVVAGTNLSYTANTPALNLDTILTNLSSVTSTTLVGTKIIGGDGTAGSAGMLQIVRPYTQPDTAHFISCVRQGSAVFGIGFHAGGANKIYLANSAGNNSTTTGITIDTNKIGINQVNPTQALDVNGNVHIGGDCNLSLGNVYKVNGTELSGANLNYSAGVTLNTKIDSKQSTITFGKNNGNVLKLQENVSENDFLLAGSTGVIGLTKAETQLFFTDNRYYIYWWSKYNNSR